MKKIDNTMTTNFKHIREEYHKTNLNIVQTIAWLGNFLLHLQKMPTHQDLYIILFVPFYTISRKYIFIKNSTNG